MPKPDKGRFDGVYGMSQFTADELFAMADAHERQIGSPDNTDDPKWLQRRADRIRKLATGKQKALKGILVDSICPQRSYHAKTQMEMK
jgi:hypothetical protein